MQDFTKILSEISALQNELDLNTFADSVLFVQLDEISASILKCKREYQKNLKNPTDNQGQSNA